MPAVFAVNFRGTKAQVAAQIDEQVTDPNAKALFAAMMAAAPGDMVSFQGAFNASPDGKYGYINLNGSFWTKE